MEEILFTNCHEASVWAPWRHNGRWKYFRAHLLAPEKMPDPHQWVPGEFLEDKIKPFAGAVCCVEWDQDIGKFNVLPHGLIRPRVDDKVPAPPRPTANEHAIILKYSDPADWLCPISARAPRVCSQQGRSPGYTLCGLHTRELHTPRRRVHECQHHHGPLLSDLL